MVDADLHLKAVGRLPVGTNHHAGVVDEDVKFWLICENDKNNQTKEEKKAGGAFQNLFLDGYLG